METANIERLEVNNDFGEPREPGERRWTEAADRSVPQVERAVVVVGRRREVGNGAEVGAGYLVQYRIAATAAGAGAVESERTSRRRRDARNKQRDEGEMTPS